MGDVERSRGLGDVYKRQIHMTLPMDMAGFIMILIMTAAGLLNRLLQAGEVRLIGTRSILILVIM